MTPAHEHEVVDPARSGAVAHPAPGLPLPPHSGAATPRAPRTSPPDPAAAERITREISSAAIRLLDPAAQARVNGIIAAFVSNADKYRYVPREHACAACRALNTSCIIRSKALSSAKPWARKHAGGPLSCTGCDGQPGDCSLWALVGGRRDAFEQLLEGTTQAENEGALARAYRRCGIEAGEPAPESPPRGVQTVQLEGDTSLASTEPDPERPESEPEPEPTPAARPQSPAARVIRRVHHLVSRPMAAAAPLVVPVTVGTTPPPPTPSGAPTLPPVPVDGRFQSVEADLNRIFAHADEPAGRAADPAHGGAPADPAHAGATSARSAPAQRFQSAETDLNSIFAEPPAERLEDPALGATSQRSAYPAPRRPRGAPTGVEAPHPYHPFCDQRSRREVRYRETEPLGEYVVVQRRHSTRSASPSPPPQRQQIRRVASAFQLGERGEQEKRVTWGDGPQRDASSTLSGGPGRQESWLSAKLSRVRRSFSGLRRKPSTAEPEPGVQSLTSDGFVVRRGLDLGDAPPTFTFTVQPPSPSSTTGAAEPARPPSEVPTAAGAAASPEATPAAVETPAPADPAEPATPAPDNAAGPRRTGRESWPWAMAML
ncbi:hypothetical protein Q8F55_008579 [Vanrija albida]|uniref:Uncharacterized protein n=1 Tax=Vanrija albida TaxID=181172 RepID=A0ABR3PR85_9TREE